MPVRRTQRLSRHVVDLDQLTRKRQDDGPTIGLAWSYRTRPERRRFRFLWSLGPGRRVVLRSS
jgi:hypothetical protein